MPNSPLARPRAARAVRHAANKSTPSVSKSPGWVKRFASHFGTSAAAGSAVQSTADSDFDFDGMVGPGDFNILASRFGSSVTATASASATTPAKATAAASPTPQVRDTPPPTVRRRLPRR